MDGRYAAAGVRRYTLPGDLILYMNDEVQMDICKIIHLRDLKRNKLQFRAL